MTTGLQNEEIVQLLRWASNGITIQERKPGLSNYSVPSKENSPTKNMRIWMGHLRHLGTTSTGAPILCTLCGLGANHRLLNKEWPIFPASDFVLGSLVCNLSSPPRSWRCPAPPITRRLLSFVMLQTTFFLHVWENIPSHVQNPWQATLSRAKPSLHCTASNSVRFHVRLVT